MGQPNVRFLDQSRVGATHPECFPASGGNGLRAGIDVARRPRSDSVGPASLGYVGCTLESVDRLKMPEDENARLKRIVADLTLDKQILQEVVRKKL